MIREEVHMTRSERLFILFAALCSFLISADYATIRPVSNALFLTAYGSNAFPYVWLATVPLNILLVSIYNKYLPKWGCLKMFFVSAAAICGFNLVCALYVQHFSFLSFIFYVWKEIYIMLLFQQLWSVIHHTIVYAKAKYLYGIFFGIGACGAALGSLVPGFFAVKLGAHNLLFASLPIYLLLCICYFFALKHTREGTACKIEDTTTRSTFDAFFHGIRLIRSSKFLLFILFIVLFMQISSTLIDYQFNHFLQMHISDTDLRAEYTGRVLGIVHTITLTLQFVGSFLFVHFLGVKRSHFFIPCVLGINQLLFLFMPTFGLISFCYITVKSLDFSLFGIVKEMMYIPLKKDEKFRAKAFIDVFAYRTSKAFASALILGLHLFLDARLQMTLACFGLLLFFLWCLFVKNMLNQRESVYE